jgi:hypothetical protein
MSGRAARNPIGQFGKVAKQAGVVASEVQRPTGVFRAPLLSALSGLNDPDDGPAGLEWKKNIEPCLFTGLFLGTAWRDCACSIWIVMRRVRANRQVLGKMPTLFSPIYGGLAGNMWKKTRKAECQVRAAILPNVLQDSQFRTVRLHSVRSAKFPERAPKRRLRKHSLKTTAPI